jgi:hypothetical protein
MHALLGHPVYENFVSWCQTLKNSSAWVRRNCNVFNLAMENVLQGLPDKIRDQLSRHHTQMHFKSNEMYTFLITICSHFNYSQLK